MITTATQKEAPVVKAAKANKSYPLWIGGAAASWAAVCTHPLDVAKVRMQVGNSKGILNTLTQSYKAAGFVNGVYPGLSASIFRQMTYSLTRFGVYDALKEQFSHGLAPGESLPPWKLAIAASIAGGLGGVAGNPADVVLVRMTGDGNRLPAQRLNYKHCFDGVFRMVREEGASSLFRGVGPNVARAVLMNASQLATYDIFKNVILSQKLMQDGLALHFTSSFLAGTVATTICAPFDVIKSRIMNSSVKQPIGTMIAKAFKEEGIRWMFRGWLPAWIRLSPNTIIIFMTLEQMKTGIDTWRRL